LASFFTEILKERSLRMGDYRVIYAVDKENRTIALIAAGHRKGVY